MFSSTLKLPSELESHCLWLSDAKQAEVARQICTEALLLNKAGGNYKWMRKCSSVFHSIIKY